MKIGFIKVSAEDDPDVSFLEKPLANPENGKNKGKF